jgi:diguanylate cyclase (GGDEF)-like protein
LERLSAQVAIFHADIRTLPQKIRDQILSSELILDKELISLMGLPVVTNDKLYGFIGFSSSDKPLDISPDTTEIVQTFSHLLATKLTMLKAEQDVEYLAYYDQLTGLPNRQLYNDRLGQAIALAHRNMSFLGVVIINLSGFKLVNDTMGHTFGDELLREIAGILDRSLRKSDTVARFNGDEFIVLLNDVADSDMIYIIMRHIMRLFSNPVKLHDQEYYVTASAGVAIYPYDGEDCDTLVKNADIAMQRAKGGDSNQFVICTTELKEEVHRNMLLSNNLYRALERGELSVHYQPQIKLATGDVIGVEALLRWNHPKLGSIPPGVFIPLAEKNGLIGSIGDWVLRTACRQNKIWQDMGFTKFRMAVNLSMVQFRNPRLVESVSNALTESGLDPRFLELEITESAAIQESDILDDILKRLKRLGVTISIDDFGTEYSSLTRLREMPVDRIKIDMQFIKGLENSEKDQAITMTIINLAKNLGLKVIAEGVETLPQIEFLKNKDCDEVQGYYYHKPMPPEDLLRLLTKAAS